MWVLSEELETGILTGSGKLLYGQEGQQQDSSDDTK